MVQVSADYISLLISLIETKFSGMETGSSDDIAFTHSYYKNTLAHLHERAQSADVCCCCCFAMLCPSPLFISFAANIFKGEAYRAIKFEVKK